jgi:hypothetical protein
VDIPRHSPKCIFPTRRAPADGEEMLFAHLKRILRLGRLRLRGPCGALFEFTLAAIAQNLRRLAKLVARSPPIVPACAAQPLQAAIKSSVSRPHNPAGGNGSLQKIPPAVPRRPYADFYNKIC